MIESYSGWRVDQETAGVEPPNKRIRAAGITTAEENAERVCYHPGGPVDGAGRCIRCGYPRPQGTRQTRAVRAGEAVTDLGGV